MALDELLPQRPPEHLFEGVAPEVVEYVAALEAMVKRLLTLVEQQGQKVDELASKLDEAVRAGKRQATPFRRPDKKKKKKRKRAGRKGGHEQSRRETPTEADEEHQVSHPSRCPCCAGSVSSESTYTQIQQDIVSRVHTRRFTVEVGRCDDCGRPVESKHPLQTSTARGRANIQIGPNALALAAQLHYGQGVPFDKIREHLAQLGLSMDRSTLVRAMDRIALRGMATYQKLLLRVLEQDVLHIDETGWSVDGEPCWLWVLSGVQATVYFVRKTRSSDEVADFLADFAGILVTDGAKAYDKLGKTLPRALCLLHLRRNARALEDKQTRGAVRLPRQLVAWIDQTLEFLRQADAMSPHDFQTRKAELEFDFRMIAATDATNVANAKLIERLRTWRDAILRCLRNPASVPPTNNHAEQMIRPAVVLRKRGGCNRSIRGARNFEVITSLLVSARQRGVDAVSWLVDLLRQPDTYAAAPFW